MLGLKLIHVSKRGPRRAVNSCLHLYMLLLGLSIQDIPSDISMTSGLNARSVPFGDVLVKARQLEY